MRKRNEMNVCLAQTGDGFLPFQGMPFRFSFFSRLSFCKSLWAFPSLFGAGLSSLEVATYTVDAPGKSLAFASLP